MPKKKPETGEGFGFLLGLREGRQRLYRRPYQRMSATVRPAGMNGSTCSV